ncbi:unnamed protein product [Moneuplotes crassus]|uniref:Cyclic nucleotide-binding domain-containing protein n=1 Tax=Euplotes crassus TaxID=5936 RepID=A0AAD1Y5B0_EUPCR|nr:unnamed protein product [Moneuplotes crassus]
MFDEIAQYIQLHEEKLKKEKEETIKVLSDEDYEKLIEQVRKGVERMRSLHFEEDPEEAIRRLSTELELKNDLGMRILQSTLQKYKAGDNALSEPEKQSLMNFLSGISSLKDKISDLEYGDEDFKKLMLSMDIINVKNCQYIYRKGCPIQNVYHVIKGEVVKVEEHTLDLKYVLNFSQAKNKLHHVIAALLLRLLIKAIPELKAVNALKKFSSVGRQKYFIDDMEPNANFLHSSKREVEISETLEIYMRKAVETFSKNDVFGEEDLLDNKVIYQTSAIAKTPCWILRVKQDIFKTQMKESVRRIKEAKAIFLYYNLPYQSKNLNYLKLKRFLTKGFKEERVKIHEEIIQQGQPADELVIIKQGDFELIKKVEYSLGYYDIQSIKESKIVLLLSTGSIAGEDGFLYGTSHSYTVKSVGGNGVVYRISTKAFESMLGNFKQDFIKMLKSRHDLIKNKIFNLKNDKKIKQTLAGGAPLNLGERRSQEEYELSRNFKYAKILPKKQFKLQLIKKKNKNTDVISAATDRYSKIPRKNGQFLQSPKQAFSDFKLRKKRKTIFDYNKAETDRRMPKKNRVLSPVVLKSKKFIERQITGMKNAEICSTQNLPSVGESDPRVGSSRPHFQQSRKCSRIPRGFSPRIERTKRNYEIRSFSPQPEVSENSEHPGLMSITGRMSHCKRFFKILGNQGSLPMLFTQSDSLGISGSKMKKILNLG